MSWPVLIKSGELTLRPLRLRDRNRWYEVRRRNREWLSPWEATLPHVPQEAQDKRLPTFVEMVRAHNREGRDGRALSLIIWFRGELAGQISMGGIIYGAMRGAHIGYWVDQKFANLGVVTAAVEALSEYAFTELQLHRLEINLRPENAASRRVAEKAGYVLEGERPRYLHIDGDWRDHICFVLENPTIK